MIKKELEPTLKSKIRSISKSVQFNDTLFYIYTSGTTGLPKAAIIKHSKFILASIMCKHVMGMRGDDVLYTAGLPLCHTLGWFHTKLFFHFIYLFIISIDSPIIRFNFFLQLEWLPCLVVFVVLDTGL